MNFKYLKNVTETSADFYVYGAIVDDNTDWWTGEESKTDVDPVKLKNELDSIENITDFNIYINSPGGSVFASSAMVSMLNRFRTTKNVKIHAYIDGLCASAATYLAMCADDINIYQNSILMIHKPMSMAWGNANELQKEIDTLNTIENDMMIPMYAKKSSKSEDEIKKLVNDESWFSGNQESDDYIGNYFDVNYLEEANQKVACVSEKLFKNYKHIPQNLNKENVVEKNNEKENQPKQQEIVEKQKLDYSTFENKISSLKKEEK